MNRKQLLAIVLVIIIVVITGYVMYTLTSPRVQVSILSEQLNKPKTITVYSPAFPYSSKIPVKYTCDGQDISISIEWDNNTLPEDTKSLVLVMYDPDAPRGIFIHWIIYNIPPNITSIPEGLPRTPIVKGIGIQGRNDFGEIGYGGPCPPPGSTHRYYIRLFALDTVLDLKPGATFKELEKAISNHVLAYGEFMGIYGR